jgi:single-strand DNA-binding protein
MLNRVVLIGRLVRDPELRYSQSGVGICKFTLAVDRRFKNAQGEKEADFIPCIAFKQLAELCANYLSKGKLAAVDGRIQTGSYTNKEGNKVYTTDVIAENVVFLSPKESNEKPNSDYGHEVEFDENDPPF